MLVCSLSLGCSILEDRTVHEPGKMSSRAKVVDTGHLEKAHCLLKYVSLTKRFIEHERRCYQENTGISSLPRANIYWVYAVPQAWYRMCFTRASDIAAHLAYSKCSKCSPMGLLTNKNLEFTGPRIGSAAQSPLKDLGPFCLSILPSSMSPWWMALWWQNGCCSSSIISPQDSNPSRKAGEKKTEKKDFPWRSLHHWLGMSLFLRRPL